MKSSHPVVTYAFPSSHRFRVPFHKALREALAARGINYNYVYAANVNDLGKGDLEIIDWAEVVDIRRLKVAGKEVVWQPLAPRFFKSDLFIIQQENKFIVNYLLILLAACTNHKVAYFGHGRNFQAKNSNSLGERWKRFWATKVDWWFAYTNQTAQLLEDYGFPRDRITVFNNAIDTTSIAMERANLLPDRVEALRNDIVCGSQNVGVYVGGMYSEKRIAFLLAAAHAIRSKVPDFNLVVIGAGPDAKLVETATEDWIHYMGPRFGKEKTELVALAKVWLMPGLVGLAVLDSFAYETPMVTCALPFHSPEFAYLEDGVNGVVVADAEDTEAYALAVVDLLINEDRRLALLKGAARARTTYTIEAMAERFANGVEKALGVR